MQSLFTENFVNESYLFIWEPKKTKAHTISGTGTVYIYYYLAQFSSSQIWHFNWKSKKDSFNLSSHVAQLSAYCNLWFKEVNLLFNQLFKPCPEYRTKSLIFACSLTLILTLGSKYRIFSHLFRSIGGLLSDMGCYLNVQCPL